MAVNNILVRNRSMRRAAVLLAVQQHSHEHADSFQKWTLVQGIWKMGNAWWWWFRPWAGRGLDLELALFFFKFLQARPAILEKQLKRPGTSGNDHNGDDSSSARKEDASSNVTAWWTKASASIAKTSKVEHAFCCLLTDQPCLPNVLRHRLAVN